MEWSGLAWIAPVAWVLLIRNAELRGRRPYAQLWAAGFLFWMAELYFLIFPHPATSLGLVAISLYLAFYLPVFVACTRVAVHRLRMPVILAAPTIWTGLELARGRLFTGFTMASLGHSQYEIIWLIQISRIVGAYGVSFVVMFVAACLARMWPIEEGGNRAGRFVFWPLAPVVVLLFGLYWFGSRQPAEEKTEGSGVRIAIIQGSIDTELKSDPGMRKYVLDSYFNLSRAAVSRFHPVDLVVWPETMFRETLITYDEDAAVPEDVPWSREDFLDYCRRAASASAQSVDNVARGLNTPILVGIDRSHFASGGQYLYNSAILATPEKGVLDHYDKLHLVLFGEYVPFGKTFPRLQRLTPLPVSLDAGKSPGLFEFQGIRLSPSICYENVLPQVIRRQVLAAADDSKPPDVLVNLTNDGWFRGSSELDLHLICGVFRAVETRRPMIIAANTGFSAWIGSDGRLLARGPRRQEGLLLAEIHPSPHGLSFYTRYGDWAAGLCLLVVVMCSIVGLWQRVARRRE